MEFLENPCPSSNSSSVVFSSLRSPEDSLRYQTPKSTFKSRIKYARTQDLGGQPSFIKFIRANTHINTVFSDFSGSRSDYIPDLEVFKDPKSRLSSEALSLTSNKELLNDFIKIREATDYELIEDKPLAKANDFIKSLYYIKASISELCRIVSKAIVFETLIMCVILANTMTIALDSIYPIPSYLELVFLLIYTCESTIKILAFGLLKPPGSYLRDKWNLLDLTIIITGWVESFQFKLNVLRILRILRPLRNISSIRGLRVIFIALVRAARPLGGTLGTLIFFIFIFAIAGIQTMMGAFRYRCMQLDTGILSGDVGLCGNSSCAEGWVCVGSLKNPLQDCVSFDSIFYALIIVFECVTLQTWVPLMNIAQESLSFATILYYVPLTFVGAFLILNLTLAVIKSSFTRSMEKVRAARVSVAVEEELLNSSLESFHDEEAKEVTRVEERLGDEKRYEEIEDEIVRTRREPLGSYRRLRRSSSNGGSVDLGSMFRAMSGGGKVGSGHEKEREQEQEQDWGKRGSGRMAQILQKKRRNTHVKALTIPKADVSKYSNTKDGESINLSDFTDTSKIGKFKRKLSKKLTNLITKGIGRSLTLAHNFPMEKYKINKSDRTSHIFSRLKHSISIRKDLVKNIKKNKEIGLIKITLNETFNLSSNSISDVTPEIHGLQSFCPSFRMGSHTFKYKSLSLEYEDEVEKKWRIESESFFSKRPPDQSRVSIFKDLSVKCSCRTAFSQIIGIAQEKVHIITKADEITGNIVGYWSGYDISEDDKRNLYYFTILSSMHYQLWDLGISGFIQKIQFIAKKIEDHMLVLVSMIIIVILNALILSFEYYGMSQTFSDAIDTTNMTFNIIFIIELAIRATSLGLNHFCRDSMNYIDTIVIILSFLELSTKIGSKALSTFRIIRIIRILRIYRFARALTFMKSLVSVIAYSLPKFIYLALLLALLNLVYALLGYQIFAGALNSGDSEPRSDFDNFGWAYLTVFQVLTLSNYSKVLYSVMRSSAGPWSALYIFIWVIIGNFILLNLFIAILLDSFMQENEDEEEDLSLLERSLTFSKQKLFAINRTKTMKKREVEKMKVLHAVNCESNSRESGFEEVLESPLFFNIECNRSYFLFSKENWFRIICYRIFQSKAFSICVFIVIYLNCIVLVLETYTMNSLTDPNLITALKICETVFTVIYILEFLVKSISIGLIRGENSYCKDPWNLLDFFILIISFLDTFTASLNLTSLKVFRVVRALRALRFISRNSSMKQLVSALLSSLGAITNVIVVMFVVWFMFAVLGISIFSGQLYECENPNIETLEECQIEGYSWNNNEFNFDNIFEAFLSLFVVGLLESWEEIMYKCIDARGQGIGGLRNYNFAAAYYFIFFIYVGSFFFLHLFMGVVFLKFHQTKKEESSIYTLLLSKKELFWVEMQRLIVSSSVQINIKRPESAYKSWVYSVVTNTKFEIFIFASIILNMISMSMSYKGSTIEYNSALDIINIGCVGVFTVELMLKIYAFGISNYCKSKWNAFDTIVVVCAYIDIILNYQAYFSTSILRAAPQIFRIFRIFKVSRLIRLFRPLKSLQNLVTIVSHSLSAIMNVISLLILCIFIYSIIGVFLFYNIRTGKYINDYNNFRDFHSACLLLLRISTGGDWPGIMQDCAKGAGRSISSFYFCSYISITVLVILNLFIMVIIQNYEDFELNPNSSLHVFTKQVRKFNKAWEKYSSFSHGLKIHHKNLMDFMSDLGPVIGFSKEMQFNHAIGVLSRMAFVLDDDGNIPYHDMLYAVLKRSYGISPNSCNDQVPAILLRKEERKTIKKLNKLERKSEWILFKKHSNKIVELKSFQKEKTRNIFYSLVLARKVLKAWRDVVKNGKEEHIHLTENEEQFCDIYQSK